LKRFIIILCLLIFVFSGILYAATKTKKVSSQKKPKAEKTIKADNNAYKYYTAGMTFHKSGNYKNAISYYNAALKADRKYWQAWLGLGICYYNMKKYSNARLIFKYVLTIKPDEATAKKYYNMMSGLQAQDKRGMKKERKLKGDMMWRSALLPGLGQFYNDELAKAYLYTFSYLASIAAIVKYTIDQQTAVDAYNNATNDFDAKYKTAKEAANRVFIPIGAAGLILSISVLDAFLSGTDAPVYYKKAQIQMLDEYTVAVKIAGYRF
jgi:tetratricopeptide (TPR) repeat protein